MSATKGNRFWEARSTHGRKPLFDMPEILWDASVEYFNWVESNPLYESKVVSYQGDNELIPVPLMRAMTVEGLCLFLDIDQQTLSNYQDKEDFFGVVASIKNVIRQQKFEGASAGLLNSNIIARDLGLKDSTDVTTGGKPIQNNFIIQPVTTRTSDG